jgi:hypothetical protein
MSAHEAAPAGWRDVRALGKSNSETIMNASTLDTRFASLVRRSLLLVAAAGAVGSIAACERALLVAPSNSVISLTADSFALSNNSSTTVTAILVDSTGKAVADGTMVSFRSSLGTIEPTTSYTGNGRAVVKLVTGNLSGIATITASSGAVQSASLQVQVGMVPGRILMSSAPTSTNTSEITATVYDTSGGVIVGASVTFTSATGTIGSPVVLTDGYGQAKTTLISSVDALVTAQVGSLSATVTARVGGSTTLAVNLAIEPAAPKRFQNVLFTATVLTVGGGAALVERYEWDYGDVVVTTTGNTTSRIWETSGKYGVTLRVFGPNGATGQTRLEFYVD